MRYHATLNGNIPFTDEENAEWDAQESAHLAESAARVQTAIVTATQARLDAWAATRAYDGILSACTYATSSVPRFMREGQDAVNARDATWAALYGIMGKVQAGELPMPSGFADIEPLLPTLEWTP